MEVNKKMGSFLKGLLYPTYLKRLLFFLFSDILIITFSLYLSFLLRFEFNIRPEYQRMIIEALPLFLFVKLAVFAFFRMYKITWRYVGINELFNIVNATVVANSVLLVLIWVPLPPSLEWFKLPELASFPRSIFLIDGVVSILLISGLRISKRLFLEVIPQKRRYTGHGKRTIIIGAGNTGEMILRDIARQGFSEFYPAGFLDDDKKKVGVYLHGVKVLGSTDRLTDVITKYNVESVIIAIPSLDYKALRSIYSSVSSAGIKTIKIVPRIYNVHKPDINIKSLEDIRIEDLIGRQIVNVDYREIEAFIRDKVVLVTGAGGSIGSEIAMQAYTFSPARLILMDIDETAVYNVGIRLKRNNPFFFSDPKFNFIVSDIRDREKVERVMVAYRPQVVLHAAAYKHVPLMEYNPAEAVKVNIFGTYNLAKASALYGVKKFIMISTDKAVRPTSVMGATKRIAEYICQGFNGVGSQVSGDRRHSGTEFISVRFGNVLGSRGSVLPLFLEQLKHGGPITVTHPEMLRYFMTIPEAVSLVLQASVIGKGGEVLVLDMGEPVKIVHLAEELIRIHGFEPRKDIDIEFVGIRPGEKLFEEILTAGEGTLATKHEKVFIAKNSMTFTLEEIEEIVNEFRGIINDASDTEGIKNLLRRHVKYYESNAPEKHAGEKGGGRT